MVAAIRRKTDRDDEVAIAVLARDSRRRVRELHRRLHDAFLNADLLDATTFRQKAIILAELQVFASTTGTPVRDEFGKLYERLRNPLMHTGPIVADSIDGLRDFAGFLERARSRTEEALDAASS
jgi:hypothetical protein